MAIYESNGSEVMEDILEDIESDESDSEARQPRWTRPRTATGGGLFQPRPATSAYVTQVQLQTALARVSAQIKTNSTAINTLTGRVNTLNDTVKKEQSSRKKDTDAVRRDLRQMRDMTVLLPLISQPSSVTLKSDVDNLKGGTKVLVDTGDTLTLLLPMLLFGGLGSTNSGGMGSSSSDSGSGSDNSMMMMAMVLALSGKGK